MSAEYEGSLPQHSKAQAQGVRWLQTWRTTSGNFSFVYARALCICKRRSRHEKLLILIIYRSRVGGNSIVRWQNKQNRKFHYPTPNHGCRMIRRASANPTCNQSGQQRSHVTKNTDVRRNKRKICADFVKRLRQGFYKHRYTAISQMGVEPLRYDLLRMSIITTLIFPLAPKCRRLWQLSPHAQKNGGVMVQAQLLH